jgi:hypothetical protein
MASQVTLGNVSAGSASSVQACNAPAKFADLAAGLKFIYCIWREEDPNIPRADLRAKLIAAGATPEFADQAIDKALALQREAQRENKPPNSAGSKSTTQQNAATSTQRNAEEAQKYADELKTHIEQFKGVYLQDELGECSVLIGEKRIELNVDAANHPLNKLLLKVCNITLHDYIARSVIERVIQFAYDAAGKFALRQFSAMSKDQERLYLPLKDSSKALCVSAEKIAVVPNGKNQDGIWIEHPRLDPVAEALDYVEADPAEGLKEFERLVVDSLAVRDPGMDWFLAVQETVYPFVRSLNNDRIIVHHDGIQGSGKTTGAMWPACVLGVKETGDTTAAALNRIGDCGLLIMDNKESANFSQGYNGYVIYLSTGAVTVRAQGDGYKMRNQSRPVGVITSIEGAIKPETIDRMIRVSFNANERDRSTLDKDAHLFEIRRKRNLIVSALIHVLQRFMQLRKEAHEIAVPEAINRFSGNYRNLVLLLRAYSETAQKPRGWLDDRLAEWKLGIQVREEDHDSGNEFTHYVEQFQRALNLAFETKDENQYVVDELLRAIVEREVFDISHKGRKGTLVRFTASEALEFLKQKNPRNNMLANMIPNTLATRLRGVVLEDGTQILTKNELPQLKVRQRAGGSPQRFLGLFEPDGNS